jgi:hypothetical protein
MVTVSGCRLGELGNSPSKSGRGGVAHEVVNAGGRREELDEGSCGGAQGWRKIRGILRRDLQTEDSLSSRMSAKARASGKNRDFFHTQKGMKSTHNGMKTHFLSRRTLFHT